MAQSSPTDMSLISAASAAVSQGSEASLTFSAVSQPQSPAKDKLMESLQAEYDSNAPHHALSTPRELKGADEPDKKARLAIESRGSSVPSASPGAGPALAPTQTPYPFDHVPQGSRPSTPRRPPSGTAHTLVRKTPFKARSQSVEPDKRDDSSKRKVSELTKRVKDLEKQLVESQVSDDKPMVDKESESKAQRDFQSMKQFFVGKISDFQQENETLREQLSVFQEIHVSHEALLKKERVEISRIKSEKDSVIAAARQSDDKYRLMINSLDQKYQESQNIATMNKSHYEKQMSSAEDVTVRLNQALAYIDQLYQTIGQFESHTAYMHQEIGTLKQELELSRLQYQEHHTKWDDWHNSEMRDMTSQMTHLRSQIESATKTNAEFAKSYEDKKADLAATTRKLEEAGKLAEKHMSRSESLELQLKVISESSTSPGANTDETDDRVDLNTVLDIQHNFQERIKGYKARIHELHAENGNLVQTITDKDNLIENMKMELAEEHTPRKHGGTEGSRTASGNAPNAQKRADSPKTPQKESPSKADRMKELLRQSKESSGDDDDDEDDNDDGNDSFVTGPEEAPRASSEVGSTSVAPLSQVGTDGSIDKIYKVPGKRTATSIDIPKFPSFNDLTDWIASIGRNLWIASQYIDKREITWLKEVHDKTFDELADPGEVRFRYLDALMIPGLEKRMPDDLRRDYKDKNKEYDKENNSIGGRQIVKMVIEYYRSSNVMNTLYSYDNLRELKWFGDDRVREFMTEWKRIVENLAIALPKDPDLRDLLYRILTESNTKLFALDLAEFKREKGIWDQKKVFRPNYSFEFLWDAMLRHLFEEKEEKILQARRLSVRAPGGNPRRGRDRSRPPAAPAPEVNKKEPKKKKGTSQREPSAKPPKGKKDKKTEGREPRATSGPPGGQRPAKSDYADHCWFHQASHYNAHKGCRFSAKDCSKTHGSPIGEDNFKKMPTPSARSRSGSRGAGGSQPPKKHNPKDLPPNTFEGRNGNIIPICCPSFRNTGVCKWKAEGKTCSQPHWNNDKFIEEMKKLNPGWVPREKGKGKGK